MLFSAAGVVSAFFSVVSAFFSVGSAASSTSIMSRRLLGSLGLLSGGDLGGSSLLGVLLGGNALGSRGLGDLLSSNAIGSGDLSLFLSKGSVNHHLLLGVSADKLSLGGFTFGLGLVDLIFLFLILGILSPLGPGPRSILGHLVGRSGGLPHKVRLLAPHASLNGGFHRLSDLRFVLGTFDAPFETISLYAF